jgi:hypothetical protein
MSGQLWWYVARSSGIVAWAMVAGSVGWGLLMTTHALGRRVRRPWLLDLHAFLGAAGVVFTVVHVITILLDSYVHFGLAEVLVPLATAWHPVAVAWGIVATYLLVAVEATSLLRKRLSHRIWKWTHMSSFPLFVLMTVHGLSAGTDRSNPIYWGATAAVTALVVALAIVRGVQASASSPTAGHPRALPSPAAPPLPQVPIAPPLSRSVDAQPRPPRPHVGLTDRTPRRSSPCRIPRTGPIRLPRHLRPVPLPNRP